MLKCSIITFTEWAYEGNPKIVVGVDGFPNRYFGTHMIVCVFACGWQNRAYISVP